MTPEPTRGGDRPISVSYQQYGRPPRRGRNGLAIALAVGIPLVVIVVVVVVVATSGGGSGGDDGPDAVAERFVTAINEGDRSMAESLLCTGATVAHGLDAYLAGDPNIQLATTPSADQLDPGGAITGTWRGEDVEGNIHLDQLPERGEMTVDPDAPWCVSIFGMTERSG